LVNDIYGLLEKYNKNFDDLNFTPHHLAHLIKEYYIGNLNIKLVKKILEEAIKHNHYIEDLLKKFKKIDDLGELEKLVTETIDNNPKAVSDYLAGKENALQFLIGYVMKKTKGQVDINLIKQLLLERLKND
jgi:aspartyl-tRNA(Asn)/glutamyl-tRNA(Gln) amidotransferase subunit B